RVATWAEAVVWRPDMRRRNALICRMPSTSTAQRPRAPRAVAVAMTICLSVWGAAQEATADAIDDTPIGAQTLNCVVDEALPNPPETAAEGGFSFFFQSLAGTATDGRACTVHRVMNLPDSPPTPVRWRAGDELLIDMARLA